MKKIVFNLLIIIGLSSCQKEQITVSTDAHDTFFLEEKGNSMPIQVHGNTASKTFLLIVHGGPGSDALIYRDNLVINTMETDFAVVYWEQRSTPISQGNTNLSEAKFEDVVSDLEKVVALLQYRYGKDISLFVNGHSWGGFLTPAYLVKGDNQKNIKGWIHTDGAHDFLATNKYLIEMIQKKAATEIAANRNVADWTEMRDYCKGLTLPLNPEQTSKMNQYAEMAIGMTPEVQSVFSTSEVVKNLIRSDAPLTSVILNQFRSGEHYNKKLFDKLTQGTDLPSKLPLIKVPTLILFGEWDFICPPKLTEDVSSKIGSSYKKTVIYKNSGHSPMETTDKYQYWADVKEFMNKFK
jgi:proline iminopeptidase